MWFSRDIRQELENELNRPEICYLFGARQVGKTSILKKLFESLPKTEKASYFNLEVPEDLILFNKSQEDIFEILKSSGKFIIIDEFHYLKNASSLFKAIYDSDLGIKIFASGSSAIVMHQHLKESLAGRVNVYKLRPLDVFEFTDSENLSQKIFSEIFTYGFLPGVFVDKKGRQRKLEERKKYLHQIYENYIQKDIKALVKEENLRAFNNLLFVLAENQGQILPSSNLSNDLRVSRATVDRYLDILENTYVLYPLNSFAKNLSNELKKSRKFYLYDLGVRNAMIKDFSDFNDREEEKGCFWESLVYYYLLHRKTVEVDIHFWRTSSGNEVDFIWNKNRKLTAIEVKSKISAKIPSGLKNFLKAYPKTQNAIVLNEDHDTEIEYLDFKVKFISYKNLRDIDQYLIC